MLNEYGIPQWSSDSISPGVRSSKNGRVEKSVLSIGILEDPAYFYEYVACANQARQMTVISGSISPAQWLHQSCCAMNETVKLGEATLV